MDKILSGRFETDNLLERDLWRWNDRHWVFQQNLRLNELHFFAYNANPKAPSRGVAVYARNKSPGRIRQEPQKNVRTDVPHAASTLGTLGGDKPIVRVEKQRNKWTSRTWKV